MKYLYLLFFLISQSIVTAQEDAWIYFSDKPEAAFYLSNPLEMLSQRALDRRANNGVSLDALDVPIHQPYVSQTDAAAGIEVMARSKWLNAVHVRGTQDAISALLSLPFVASIDFANHSLNTGKTNKKPALPFAKTALVEFPYGGSANQIQMLNGHLLHEQDFTGSGKIIAVLDAGFPEVDIAEPFARLRDNNLILGGYNFVDDNTDFYSRNSHGTLVLSTMGGYTANQLVGTAPDAAYYLFITEDVNSENPVEESYWVEAAEVADSLGVDIINSSLGYFGYDNPSYSYDFADMNAVTAFASRGADIAFSRGMVVVASAGNTGNSDNPNIGVPADAINVLTVGAVNSAGAYVGFSSVGPTADGRIKPDVAAQGLGVVVANAAGNITTSSGTSFSGPIIAGMIASFWQAAPSLTHQQVVDVVKQSAHLYDTPNNQLGYGIPNFELALAIALLNLPENQLAQVFVSPNPANDFVNLALPEFSDSNIEIFDSLGRKTLSKAFFGPGSIDVGHLQSGIYYYRINLGAATKTGKLIKN